MGRTRTRRSGRIVRHSRVRRQVKGTPRRPRLAVFRSLVHMYAQIIDDTEGITLAAASSLEDRVRKERDGKQKLEASKIVGSLLGQRAKGKGITNIVFDRGGYKYHGRVKALADAARAEGLVF